MPLGKAMPAENVSAQRSTFMAWGALIVAGLIVSFACLGSYSTLGTHEVIGGVPAREMLHTGDWVVPRYGDVPRTRKPPLLYWTVASAGWLFGELNEFVIRIHSAMAFLGLAVLMSLWAARWYGREAAFGAALIQMTSIWTINFGRRADVDMLMCLLTTGAMFLIATQPEQESPSRSRLRWIGILTLIGLTWLAKFHYGMAMVLGPVFVFWVLQRRWQSWLNLVSPIGLLILSACALIWPWLLLREVPEALELIRRETIGRALGEFRQHPWWYYGPKLLLLPLPWTAHFLLGASQSWLRAWRHGDSRERFLWVWLIVDLLIVSVSKNKHENYLLAALPVVTLLASQTVARGLARVHRDSLRVPKFVPHVMALSIVVALVAVNLWVTPDSPAILAGIRGANGIALCGAIATWWCWQQRRRSAAGWTSLAAMMGIFLVVVNLVTPELDARRDTVDFARSVRANFLGDQPVCVYVRKGVLPGSHPSIYYLAEPVYQVSTLSELLQEVKHSGDLLAVVETENLPRLRAVAPHVDQQEIARMTPSAGSREQPLVCLRLRDRRGADQQTAAAMRDALPVSDPAKRR
jgi:4-amino-4-deoxy-L-arabinose transferase-like glycosyltransferase